MSQPDHHAVLQDFFRWESQSWIEVVADITTDEKTCFMPVETLKSYLKSDGSKKLNKILSELFQSEDIPINPEIILRTHTAVFCILLRISKGRYIEYFARYEELSDQRLPFDLTHPPACFPAATDDSKFLQRFCEKQWMYCVPIFDNHMVHKHFGRQRLLPITHKERLGGGGSAIIYKIKLYGPHNKLFPDGSQIQMNNTNPNVFILKRYVTKDTEEHYNQEVRGFNALRHPESIIGFYGSYIHGDDYNILLEFADKGSLKEYFQRETPPSRGDDIIKFWARLFELIKALKAIHSNLGWHQDVKPVNVLVLSYGAESAFDWQFKLADFGLSHFIKQVPLEGDAMANDSRGTRTYGAPECYMPSNLDDQIGRSSTKISQAVDIWSLGCIYSEAAMWIADGYKGVVDYRRQRMAETDKILNFKGGDCFHDGERVLKAVGGAHEDIEHRLRRSDYITKDVLDSMVVEMMWDEDRPNAKAMWRKAEGVLSRAQQRLPSNTEDNFTRSHNYNRSPTYLSPQPPPVQPQAPPPGLHVDAWRKEVSGPSGELVGPNYDEGQTSSMESVTEFGSQLTGSIPGLQGASSSLMTTPITSPFTSPLSSPFNSSFNSPFTSPRVNPQHDVYRRLSNEGQLRTLQNRRSSGQPSDISHRQSHIIATRLSDNRLMAPNELGPRVEFLQEAITMTPTDGEGNSDSFVDDAKTIGQVSRQSSSAYFVPITGQAVQREPPSSSAYFVPITSQAVQREPPSYPYSPDDFPIPPRSEKRPKALPLQPLTSPTSQAPQPPVVKHTAKTSIHHQIPVARYASFSNNPALHVSTHLSGRAHSVEYLSLAEALEWKKAHKKPKKRGRESSLRGADLLDVLKHRDHIFIIDDGSSMREQWPAVKEAFEALSYIVKPMAPDGIELFFTVSYDTWRRHDTKELVEKLEKKGVGGDTNISYRLGLQLDFYKPKIELTPRKRSAKSKKVRPMCFYILTDGNWTAGGDPIAVIKGMADHLISADLKNGQVTVQFISFGQNAVGLQRMNDLANTNFGLDIVDTTPSTDNVLKMLRGAFDKSLFQGCSTLSSSRPAPPAPSELACY